MGHTSGALRLIYPVITSSESVWIALTTNGSLFEITFNGGSTAPPIISYRHITDITPDDLSLAEAVSLVCSEDGKLACLTETLGSKGVVIETSEGQRTLRLLRDGYHNDVSPFPAAFIEYEGRTLLVHSPAWNRLDVSDPWSGEILTERSPTSYKTGEPRPAHYLDYFHGRLLPSPNSTFLVDDGWVWHPVGVVRSWSVREWLENNLWESEDGPSVRNLRQRYFWTSPMCWMDATTLVVWGYSDDDTWQIPAVRILDAVSGKERNWFPGPEVAPLTDDWRKALSDFGGRLFFDKYLFSVSEKFGVSVWNADEGARLHQDASFAPVAYHPGTKEFLTILPDGSVQLSRLTDAEALA